MKRQLNISRIITIVSALVLAVVMAVGSTFSWYNRPIKNVDYDGDNAVKTLNYNVSGKVNAPRNATFSTYLGIEDNGKFTYSENEIASSLSISKSQNIVYFKTVIDNHNQGDALVSLYLEGLNYTNFGTSIDIGIINPEKTLKNYTTTTLNGVQTKDYLCIADNILVPTDTAETDSDDTFSVYWFIKFNGAPLDDCVLDLGKMHLVYN